MQNTTVCEFLIRKCSRIDYAPIVVFILLLASFAMVGPSIASEHHIGNGETCHATGQLSGALLLPPVAERDLDMDSDGNAEFQFNNRMITAGWDGDVEGRGTALQVVLNDVDDKVTSITALANLAVSVCNSEPGSMAVIFSIIIDNSAAPPISEAKMAVIEGTGTLGLEGICGGGTTGAGTYDFTFNFGDACD